jgi:hypothetical protein
MHRKIVRAAVIVCAMLVVLPITGFAQDQAAQETKNAISMNLFMTGAALFTNFTSAGELSIPLYFDYRHVLADHFVLYISPSVLYWGNAGYKGITIEPIVEVDWHPFDLGLNGPLLGAFIDISNVYGSSTSPTVFNTEEFTVGVGPAAGYELTLLKCLLIECSGGLEAAARYDSNLASSNKWMLVPLFRLDIGLGYRF